MPMRLAGAACRANELRAQDRSRTVQESNIDLASR